MHVHLYIFLHHFIYMSMRSSDCVYINLHVRISVGLVCIFTYMPECGTSRQYLFHCIFRLVTLWYAMYLPANEPWSTRFIETSCGIWSLAMIQRPTAPPSKQEDGHLAALISVFKFNWHRFDAFRVWLKTVLGTRGRTEGSYYVCLVLCFFKKWWS